MKCTYMKQEVESFFKEHSPGKWEAVADFRPRLKSGVGTDSISVPPMYPTQAERNILTSGKFKFTRQLHRFQVNLIGKPKIEKPGILWIESKVRKLGNDDWLTQRYPIIVEVGSKQSAP